MKTYNVVIDKDNNHIGIIDMIYINVCFIFAARKT